MGLRVVENDQGGYNNTYALNDISDNVNKRCSNVHVFMVMSMMTVASMPMAMTSVSMIVFVIVVLMIFVFFLFDLMIMIVSIFHLMIAASLFVVMRMLAFTDWGWSSLSF